MRKYLAACLIALTTVGVPTAAFASKPTHPTHPTTPSVSNATGTNGTTHLTPTVMYVLRGTLSSYTAATSSAAGSITIVVKTSNFEQKILKGTSLTFVTGSTTRVVLHKGKPITNGDRAIVKVRAPKKSDATALQAKAAFQIVDQGVAH